MKFGVLHNIAGNIEALADADRQFDEFGVEAKVCLGHVVGLYPYIDACVEFLLQRKYVTLRSYEEEAFVAYCEGSHGYEAWSMRLLADALMFARRSVSEKAVQFFRDLPERWEVGSVSFESRLIPTVFLNKPKDAAEAFASRDHQTIVHTATLEPSVWREDLTETALSPGRNRLESSIRAIVTPGGAGCKYAGSRTGPSALVFDEAERTVHLFRPMCDADKLLARLRQTEYPPGPMRYLETNEYEIWRSGHGRSA